MVLTIFLLMWTQQCLTFKQHPKHLIKKLTNVKPFTFQFSLSNFFSQRNDYAHECRLGHHIDIYICIQKSDTENNVQKGLVSVYHWYSNMHLCTRLYKIEGDVGCRSPNILWCLLFGFACGTVCWSFERERPQYPRCVDWWAQYCWYLSCQGTMGAKVRGWQNRWNFLVLPF